MPNSLGDRMKLYERAHDIALPPRMPLIVRVDGRAFHSWTRGFERPFDFTLIDWMDNVAISLCKEIAGAQMAYVQSDEVSVLVHNYKRHETEPWVKNRLQKITSLAASIAASTMTLLAERVAEFDARAFVLPESEVANYFLWRQQDATRNSIQMLARSVYSHKQCDGKSQSELQEMCWQKGENWNDLPAHLKRGRCVLRHPAPALMSLQWAVDTQIPIWKNEGRDYIESFLVTEEEAAEEEPENV